MRLAYRTVKDYNQSEFNIILRKEIMNCTRKILPNLGDFKLFWKENGPFRYALTSNEYPPVLLEPEEWIFGNDKISVLKELMQFFKARMAFCTGPF